MNKKATNNIQNEFIKNKNNNYTEKSFEELIYTEPKLLIDNKSQLMQDIILEQTMFNLKVNLNLLKHKEIINLYQKFIAIVANLIKELGLPNNSISYSLVISRLIKEGHLSNKGIISITQGHGIFKDLYGYFGIDILNGYGCCRHTSSIHQDIFKKLKLNSSYLPCLHSMNISLEESFKIKGNHLVNLIEYEGVYYAYDTLHNRLYEFEDSFTMTPYPKCFGDINILFYKPSFDMILNNKSQLEVIKKIKKIYTDSKSRHISILELNEIFNETNYIYNKNDEIIYDFVKDTKSYIKKLTSSIKKIPNS